MEDIGVIKYLSKKYINGKIRQVVVFSIYIIMQVLFLFFLRRQYLLTVYQTVATYFAVSSVGLALIYLGGNKEDGRLPWKSLIDIYLITWSSFHGVIVLGFLTYEAYYLTLTQITIIEITNIFLGFAVYWIAYITSGKCMTAIGIGNVIIGLLGILNHYLVRFRGAPLQVSDIKAVRTARNVLQNYNFSPDVFIVTAIADLALWYCLIRYWYGRGKACSRRNILNIVMTVFVIGGCIALPVAHFDEAYVKVPQFVRNHYLSDLLADILGNAAVLPIDYSAEVVQDIIASYQQEDSNGERVAQEFPLEQLPNILVIMNEAFSDFRVLGDFSTNMPVLEYWDSIQEDVIRGWANVSVLGGNTSNSEYDFLSSDAVSSYTGISLIPYNHYFSYYDVYPGLVSVLKEQGYECVAFHPYYSSGWNRTQVYRAMQFDNIIFLEDIEEELDELRIYVSDKGNYSYIRDWFEKKEDRVPQFFFNVTMQNHGGYTYSGENFETTIRLTGEATGCFPLAEQFLSLMKASDEAFEELLTYFRDYPEPVIVLLFGDHQPNLEAGFYEYISGQAMGSWGLEQRMNQYKTPFIIWSNYGMAPNDLGDVSLNYLAPILLQSAGLEMSDFQHYVLKQWESMPVINTLAIKDRDGNLYPRGGGEFNVAVREYRMLIYNHTVDKEGRKEEFFVLEP